MPQQQLPDDLFTSDDDLPPDLFASDDEPSPSFGNVSSGGSKASPSFLDSVTSYIPDSVKHGWEVANKPLTSYLPEGYQPGQQARTEAENDPVTPEDWNIPFTGGAKWKGLRQGLNIGSADVLSGLTSPLNLATTAATMGTEPLLAAGYGGAARAANLTGRALSAPVAGHGAYEMVRPDASLSERLFGAAEFAGGAAGTQTAMPVKKPGLRSISPEAEAGLAEQTNNRLLELEHNANSVVKSSPEKKAAFAADPQSRMRELIAKEDAGALGGQELNELISLRQQNRSVDPNLNSGIGDAEQAGSAGYQRAPDAGLEGTVRPTKPPPKSRADKSVSRIEKQIPQEMMDSFSLADDESPSPNASGESAASGEAMSRQAGMRDRGEAYVVYDKSGVARNLIGPEAVDYQPKPGETYGIKTPRGFVQLNNNGGNVPPTTKVMTPRRPKAEYPGFKGQEPGPELGDVTGLRGRLDAATAGPETNADFTGPTDVRGINAELARIRKPKATLMDKVKGFAKEESGEFNPNALEEYLNEPDDLMEAPPEDTTRRVDPETVPRWNRQEMDSMPIDNIQRYVDQYVRRYQENPSPEVKAIIDYGLDLVDAHISSTPEPPAPTRQQRLGQAFRDIRERRRGEVEPTTSHSGGEHDFGIDEADADTSDWTPEDRADFSTSPTRTRYEDRFPQRPEPMEGKGKSLDELEASKRTPALERLGKLIGEDRAGKLSSGETKIDFSDRPLRSRKEKKLSGGTIAHWAEWGDNMVNDVTEDTSKPGMHIVEPSKYFPKKLEIEFRDDSGKPLGVLRSDMAGGGISTLAVSSKIGLRRGKVAFAMLKEAFDRGLTEPSGATSDLTKNLIDRVKRLAKNDKGEFDSDVVINEINKLIDSISTSKIGKAVGDFMKDDSGSAKLPEGESKNPLTEHPEGPAGETGKMLVRNVQSKVRGFMSGGDPQTLAEFKALEAQHPDFTPVLSRSHIRSMIETLRDRAEWGKKEFPHDNVPGQRSHLEQTATHLESLANDLEANQTPENLYKIKDEVSAFEKENEGIGNKIKGFMKDESGEFDPDFNTSRDENRPQREDSNGPIKQILKDKFGPQGGKDLKPLASHLEDAKALPPGPEKDGIIRKTNSAMRSMLTTWDLSAPGRQGKAFLLNKAYWTSLDDMIRAWGSEHAAEQITQSITEHPSGYFKPEKIPVRDKKGQLVIDQETGLPKSKLGPSFAEKSGLDLAPNEEAFKGTFGDKIKKYSGINKASRAHTAFLNKLRSDQFVAFVEASKKAGRSAEDNPQIAEQFAKFINDGTGRGSLNVGKWKLERNAGALSDVFFAPKNMSGQIRTWNAMLNPARYIKADPILRRQAVKSLFAVAGAGMAVGELAKMAGGDVSNDPSSTDFRKIVVGDTRIDLFGGYQQFPVAAMRLLLGKSTGVSQGGAPGKTNDLSSGRFGMPSRASVAERFFTNRLSPVPAFVWAWMNNREFDGKPFEIKRALYQRALPIAISDLYQLAKEDPKLAAILSPLLITGIAGTQTYTRE